MKTTNWYGRAAGMMMLCISIIGILSLITTFLSIIGNPWMIDTADESTFELIFVIAVGTPITILFTLGTLKYMKDGKSFRTTLIVLDSISIAIWILGLLVGHYSSQLLESEKFMVIIETVFYSITVIFLVLAKPKYSEYPNVKFTKDMFIGELVASVIIAIFSIVLIINIMNNTTWIDETNISWIYDYTVEGVYPSVGDIVYKWTYTLLPIMLIKNGYLSCSILFAAHAFWNLGKENSFLGIKKQDTRTEESSSLFGLIFFIGFLMAAISLALLCFTPFISFNSAMFTWNETPFGIGKIAISKQMSKGLLITWTILSVAGIIVMIPASILRSNSFYKTVEGYEMEKVPFVEEKEEKVEVKAAPKTTTAKPKTTTSASAAKKAVVEVEEEEVVKIKKPIAGPIVSIIGAGISLFGSLSFGLVFFFGGELFSVMIITIIWIIPALTLGFSINALARGKTRIAAGVISIVSIVTCFPIRLISLVLYLIGGILTLVNK